MRALGACTLTSVALFGAHLAAACGGNPSSGDGEDSSAPATAGRAGSDDSAGNGGGQKSVGGGTSSGGSTVNIPSTGGRGGGTFEECAGDLVSGKLAPLDMFLMLDTSGSMLDSTEAGEEKWTSVKEALVAFLSDQGSAGLGVGIQYFPLRKPNVPATCTANAQCGADGGPCLLKTCWDAPGLVACNTTADCRLSVFEDYGDCVTFGFCANDPSYICPNPGPGVQCGLSPDGVNLGACRTEPSVCVNGTECDVAAYAEPAVPIAVLPQASAALVSSIEARTPEGLTPTAPAIRGAVEHARTWASSHSDHVVVSVLATDGLPTECLPLEIPNVAGLAAAGVQGTPSIRTFVIGVFGPNDPDAQANLDTIARAGGTERAFIVDTTGNVSTQFLQALSTIRGSLFTCDFQIPAPMGADPLDYDLVNVQFTRDGTSTPLFFTGTSEADCPAEGGWYYNSDPGVTAPTRIVMCPTTCETLQAATTATVQIQLGCAIRVR
jgi:hypothetical protein